LGLSERQFELVNAGATVLLEHMQLTRDETTTIILTSLKRELDKRHTNLETLEFRPRSERTSFIRSVVHDVQVQIEAKGYWPKPLVQKAIAEFMTALHASWIKENE